MNRSITSTVGRMVCTFVGSYAGAKVAGWLFDTLTSRNR